MDKKTTAAIEKGNLYGARFEGFQEVVKGSPYYVFTDLVTMSTTAIKKLSDLPDALSRMRAKFNNPKNKAREKALKLSEKFFDMKPRFTKKIDIDYPKVLIRLGTCERVDYISDKFDGKNRYYYHEFDGPCELFTGESPQKNGYGLLIIIGKFKIKPEGITG